MANNNYTRIAKNTVMLYFRMLLTLFISLFTSRVILKALGFEDFGLYNVVGGFISLLAFLNGYISQATTRFLTFAIGKGNLKHSQKVFSASLMLHVCIALFLLLVGETLGVWYVDNKLNIPVGRENIAMFVYQLSLITGCISIVQTPYLAGITAHEDMGIYAYIGIFDAVMKLLIAYLLMIVEIDRLCVYSVFYFIVSFLTFSFYLLFCCRKYSECRFCLRIDISLYRKMFAYIGWNAIGAVAFTCNGQGVTLLLNYFFGTIINAARGVAGSISNIVSQFVFNFQTAMRPQIIKSYAQGDLQETEKLVIYCSKYSSYLCILFGIPLFIESDTILHIWLGDVPPFAPEFVRLSILQVLIQAVDFPVGYGINAVGKMKLPNLTSSLAYLLILPLAFLAMYLGANPTFAYVISILCFPLAMFCDVWILHKYIGFNMGKYYKDVLIRTSSFIFMAGIPSFFLHTQMENSFIRLILVGGLSFFITAPLVYYKGLEQQARDIVARKIRDKIPFIK